MSATLSLLRVGPGTTDQHPDCPAATGRIHELTAYRANLERTLRQRIAALCQAVQDADRELRELDARLDELSRM